MAAGRAVVASDIHGYKRVVQRNVSGLLVEPRDHQAMARAILTLLKDEPLRRRMGAAGAALVRANFSAERMVEETLRVYERVTAAHAMR